LNQLTENEVPSQADVSPSLGILTSVGQTFLSAITNIHVFRHVPGAHYLPIVALILVAPAVVADAPDDGIPRTAWSLFGTRSKAVYDSAPGKVTPHPAVARIIVPEDGSTAFGSGTLVGVNKDHGLVITNWHVVRDGVGLVEALPDGFRSNAKPLKVDSDWDLAALVIWRPNIEPVKIARSPRARRPGPNRSRL